MTQARSGTYWCYDLGDMELRDALRQLSDCIIGTIAVNTAFDSGRYPPFDDPLPVGWGRIGGYAVSQPIRSSDLETWPISHDDFCDEWYFLARKPVEFEAQAFCNYLGMRIIDWEKLEFEGGLDLEAILKRIGPELVVGNNERTYAISKLRLTTNFGLTNDPESRVYP